MSTLENTVPTDKFDQNENVTDIRIKRDLLWKQSHNPCIYLPNSEESEESVGILFGTSGPMRVKSIGNWMVGTVESGSRDYLELISRLQEKVKSLEDSNKYLMEYTKSIKQELNLNKIEKIAKYNDNWDGYGAKKFSNELIQKVKNILFDKKLKIQPSVFPTLRESIQLEFTIKKYFFEIEVSIDKIEMIIEDELSKKNKYFEDVTWEEVLMEIEEVFSGQ
ncbi:MAG: hypothetical protein MUP85_24240 [Candidatus Lokiarchaeota archaeon]|nr:hypothetical protein [Candidatus Lokiarchaeota archaeon]